MPTATTTHVLVPQLSVATVLNSVSSFCMIISTPLKYTLQPSVKSYDMILFLAEEEEPMIRGFADDEPLVIA